MSTVLAFLALVSLGVCALTLALGWRARSWLDDLNDVTFDDEELG